MIVPTPAAPHIRAEPEPHCIKRAAPTIRPQVDVALEVNLPQNTNNRLGNRLEDLSPQNYKHKGMFRLVYPNDLTCLVISQMQLLLLFVRGENVKRMLMDQVWD